MPDTYYRLVPQSSGPAVRTIRVNIGGVDVDMQVVVSASKNGSLAEPIFIQYAGSGYTYYCEAPPGTSRSTAGWQVTRKTDATGDFIPAGNGLYEHSATDLSVVAALAYTLGA